MHTVHNFCEPLLAQPTTAKPLIAKMASQKISCACITLVALLLPSWGFAVAETPIDLSAYQKDCEVRVEGWNGNLRLAWPTQNDEETIVTLDLSGTKPLIESM